VVRQLLVGATQYPRGRLRGSFGRGHEHGVVGNVLSAPAHVRRERAAGFGQLIPIRVPRRVPEELDLLHRRSIATTSGIVIR
jgi:hypothetical protein